MISTEKDFSHQLSDLIYSTEVAHPLDDKVASPEEVPSVLRPPAATVELKSEERPAVVGGAQTSATPDYAPAQSSPPRPGWGRGAATSGWD